MESIQEIRRRKKTSLSVVGWSTQSRWNYGNYCSAGRGLEPWMYCHKPGHWCWRMMSVLGTLEYRKGSWAAPRCKSDGLGSVTKLG